MRKRSIVAVLAFVGCFSIAPLPTASACPCPWGQVVVDGLARAYRVCAPGPGDSQLPVVMHFHDKGETATKACRSTNWHELGSKATFITVYAQGCDATGTMCNGAASSYWNDEAIDGGSTIDDVAYVRTVLARVATDYKVDPTRVYAAGLGQGANVASLIACRTADAFAAVAPVNGAAKFPTCAAGNHVSVFPVNGDKDNTAPWMGCCGALARDPSSASHVAGCEALPACALGTTWSPPVLGGYHPVAATFGYDDLPGLEGIAERVCPTDPGPFDPRACPEDIAAGQGRCYGIENCSVGPGPAQSEVFGLRLSAGRHAWKQLEGIVDLKQYLWARLSTARKPLLAIACNDAIDDVYATPVAAAEAVSPGTVLRCARMPSPSAEELVEMLEDGAPGVEVLTGVSQYLVAYRTGFVPGEPAVGSAVIVLPDQPIPGPLPVIVGGPGNCGLADICAPSKSSVIPLVLAWAAVGYPAIMPDYAGLGTAGIQPTGSFTAAALSQLDGGRAVLDATPDGLLDGRVVIVGHSQGGAGALLAQGLAGDYAPDLDLVAVVAFAATYDEIHPLLLAFVPWIDVTGGAGVFRAIAASTVYSTAAVVVGEEAAAAVFQPAVRGFTADTLRSYCTVDAIDRLGCLSEEARDLCAAARYVPPKTVGQMFTAATLAGLRACLLALPSCTDDYRAMVALTDNAVPLDPQGADMLFLAGIDDTIVPAANVACSVQLIERKFGLYPDACASEDDHMTVTQAQTAYQIAWVKAKLAGAAPPACPENLPLPACPY